MVSWPELRARCDALEEPFRSQCIEFFMEAHRTAEVYREQEGTILWQLDGCVTAVEWDAVHGAPAMGGYNARI